MQSRQHSLLYWWKYRYHDWADLVSNGCFFSRSNFKNTVHLVKQIFHDFIFKVGTARKILIKERFLFCIRINITNLVEISGWRCRQLENNMIIILSLMCSPLLDMPWCPEWEMLFYSDCHWLWKHNKKCFIWQD